MIYLVILFAGLNIADAVTTYIGLRNSNVREGNPLAVWLFAKFGLIPMLVITKGVVLLLGLYIGLAKGGYWVLVPLIGLYAYGVYNNLKVIRRA